MGGGGLNRKNNINSSRNYELQLFSCLGHFSSSFLSSAAAAAASQLTWLSTCTHTHTLLLSFLLFFRLLLSPCRPKKTKNKAWQESKKSWQTFKYLNVLSSRLSRKCYAATPTLAAPPPLSLSLTTLSLLDLTEIEFPVSCLLLLCAFAGTRQSWSRCCCLTFFCARSAAI